MSSTDPLGEEARAALWRDQQRNRVQYQHDLWLSLQAPPEPRQQVMDDWEAILLAQAERAAGPTDPEQDP